MPQSTLCPCLCTVCCVVAKKLKDLLLVHRSQCLSQPSAPVSAPRAVLCAGNQDGGDKLPVRAQEAALKTPGTCAHQRDHAACEPQGHLAGALMHNT